MNNQVSTEFKVDNLVGILRKGFWAIGLSAVVGFGFIGVKNFQNTKAEKAFGELFMAEKLEELAEREAGALQKKPVEIMKQWSDEKKKEYISKLQGVYNNYKGQTAAAMAGLKIGRWHLDNGEYALAETQYLSMLSEYSASKNSERNILRVMILEGLCVSLEESQKWAEAEKYFNEGAEMPDNPLRPLSLMGLARVQRKLNKTDEAKKTYEKVFADFPDTTYEKKARALRALMDQPSDSSAKG